MDESKGVESFCLIVDYKDYGRKHMDMKTNMVKCILIFILFYLLLSILYLSYYLLT